MSAHQSRPLFSATAGSARQIFLLLRCIHFVPKAQVLISVEGLRFSVEDARVMEGLAFLQRSLFTSYSFTPESSSSPNHPAFTISLSALLESLQILSLPSASGGGGYSGGSFTSSTPFASHARGGAAGLLGSGPHCHFLLRRPGAPFTVTLTENNLTTTCELTTYDPPDAHLDPASSSDDLDGGERDDAGKREYGGDIPFARDRLTLKIIMPPASLLGAINELAATGPPERLLLRATAHHSADGVRALSLSGEGPLGSAAVEFTTSSASSANASFSTAAGGAAGAAAGGDDLLETFRLGPAGAVRSSYRFAHLARARRALAAAAKVSVRADAAGVLSWQFMIATDAAEGGGGGAVGASFVDFRFVPLLDEDEDGEGSGSEEDGEDGEL